MRQNPFFKMNPEEQRIAAKAFEAMHPILTFEEYTAFMRPQAKRRAFGIPAGVPAVAATVTSTFSSEVLAHGVTNVTDGAPSAPTQQVRTISRGTIPAPNPDFRLG